MTGRLDSGWVRAAWIALVILFFCLPLLGLPPNRVGLLNHIGLYAILALSLNVILGQAGMFHMGHAAFFAVGAYATAILNTACGWPVLATLPVAGAAAIDQGAAKLMGIDVRRVVAVVFMIGPALGGLAGVMVGLSYGQINFTMGQLYGLKAFTAAILGGIGNIPGAMLGGILLGLLEAFGAAYISVAWKDALAFSVLILILVFRPTGLLPERVAEKL